MLCRLFLTFSEGFAVRGSIKNSKRMKKVLIITYYWPPSGAIGVHRCLKFAKYLRNFGWEPIIYTAENAQYPYLDKSNYRHIPENITVLKHKIFEPFSLYKIASGKKKDDVLTNPVQVRDKEQKFIDKLAIWIRGNFFIPDARSLWINPSVRYLSKFLKENKVDAIISDGPPHTNTVIAYKLSEKFNIPWLADYQDPWTQVDYYNEFMLTKFADKRHKRMEQKAFEIAKKTTIASPSWKKDLQKIGAHNVDVIFWGYDEDDFKNLKSHKSTEFLISHAGLLGHDRNPEIFFKVLRDLKKQDENFSKKLKIKLAGPIDYAVKQNIEKYGLNKNTEFLGSIPRNDALQLTLDSSLLLLPLNKAENAMGRIPGKLFEQMRAHVPILCLGPKASDVENIITETKTGKSFEYDDYEGIKNYILDLFNEYSKEEKTHENIDITKYSVTKQVEKIASFLDEIIKRK